MKKISYAYEEIIEKWKRFEPLKEASRGKVNCKNETLRN